MNVHEIIEKIRNMKAKASQSKKKIYDFDLAERIVLRMDSFAECNECRTYLNKFDSIIEEMKDDPLIKANKNYFLFQKEVLAHLLKSHKLVTPGYYVSMYMAFGVAFGLPFGLLFSQLLGQMAFMGIGLPIGIGIGLSIGSSLDSKAKKDGLVI